MDVWRIWIKVFYKFFLNNWFERYDFKPSIAWFEKPLAFIFATVYSGQLYQMPLGSLSLSCQSLNPYRNSSKMCDLKAWGKIISSVFFRNYDWQLYKTQFLVKKTTYLFVNTSFYDFND